MVARSNKLCYDYTTNTMKTIHLVAVYDDTALTAQIVIRRKWDDVLHYDLNTNTMS